MKTIVYSTILLLSLVMSNTVFALPHSVFKEKMTELKQGKLELVEKFLEQNSITHAKQADYYVLLLNHAIRKAYTSGIGVSRKRPSTQDAYALKREDGSTAGYLGVQNGFDAQMVTEAIAKTRSALKHFNNRLDIHFGMITLAEKIEHWELVSTLLVNTLKAGKRINQKWIWGPVGSMRGEPEEFMIQNVLGRMQTLFQKMTPTSDKALEEVSFALTKYHPDKPYGYNTLGTLYAFKKEYDQAQTYFEKAQTLAPDDPLIKNNLNRLKELKNR